MSEDFDMALRLQMRGYIIRWATYSKGGFKEGVSLTVDDELNRWQKYAYGTCNKFNCVPGRCSLEAPVGCNELLFNPIFQWWRKGPIAHQIHRFLWSNAPLHYKFSMMAYMFSYCEYPRPVFCTSADELLMFLLRWYRCRHYH